MEYLYSMLRIQISTKADEIRIAEMDFIQPGCLLRYELPELLFM